MKTEILQILRGADGYVSGQMLCDKLGVSRTAVWKAITALKHDGYDFDAAQNKGYRLTKEPDVLTEYEIRSRLVTRKLGRTLHCEKRCGSTNSVAKQMAEDGAADGLVVTTEEQSAGRGRRGRVWTSPVGEALSFSVLLRPQIEPDNASMLTLVMGLAAAKVCDDFLGESAKAWIKWPNDVVVNGRKACGILTEMSTQIDYIDYVVIGVGVNTGVTDFPDEIAGRATSLHRESGRPCGRAQLLCDILAQFEIYYENYMRTQDLSGLAETYNACLINRDRNVKVLAPGCTYIGHAKGIDERGRLIVTKKDGTTESVYAGEVSVRGAYGYI